MAVYLQGGSIQAERPIDTIMNGQFCVTVHNTTPVDIQIPPPYRIWQIENMQEAEIFLSHLCW